MDFGLKNRVVLVTGGSAGIGQAAAIAFGREGAKVVVTYYNNRERAEDTAQAIIGSGGEAIVVKYDLANDEIIRRTAQMTLEKWGTIDVLVNNAVQWGDPSSITHPPLFEDVPAEIWRKFIRTNFEGVYLTIQQVVPAMRKQKWGRVVSLSSSIAERALPGSAPYAAAKSALHGLHRALAAELGGVGILSNVVLPGLTLTDHVRQVIPEKMREMVAQNTPTGRGSTPEEIAATIVFLGSAANGHINGELVRVNGGL